MWVECSQSEHPALQAIRPLRAEPLANFLRRHGVHLTSRAIVSRARHTSWSVTGDTEPLSMASRQSSSVLRSFSKAGTR